MTEQQHGRTTQWVEVVQVVVLILALFGSLPVFAIVAAPVDSLALSVLIGFGGWSVWCSIVMYVTQDWVNTDD